MKRIFSLFFASLSLVMICGCASTKAYFSNRGNDAIDIVTLTGGGEGIGVQGRAGPIHLGLLLERISGRTLGHEVGIRGGEVGKSSEANHVSILFFMDEDFEPAGGRGARGKWYHCVGAPLISWPLDTVEDRFRLFNPYYTQIEATAGFLRFVRVGVNAGEALDFLLGWFCIDMFNDDIVHKETATPNPTTPAPAATTPQPPKNQLLR